MKKRALYIFGGLVFCLAILFLCGMLQPHTTCTVSSVGSSNLGQFEEQGMQAAESIDGAAFNTLYTVRISRLFSRDEVFVFVPYVCGDISPVPTVGSVPWNYTAGIVAMRWRGDQQMSLSEIQIKDANLIVTADSNTVLNLEKMTSSCSWQFPSQFSVSEENHSASVYVGSDAMVKASPVEPDSNRSCAIRFEGSCVVPHSYFGPFTMVDFCVDTDISYINNVK